MSRSLFLRNLKAWEAYNRTRIERAIDIGGEPAVIALRVVPFLIHNNINGFPGYVPFESSRWGIYKYHPGRDEEVAIQAHFPNAEIPDADSIGRIDNPFVDSLLLMGSIGTVGHTKKSDYDYWVVIGGNGMSDEEHDALRKKTEAIQEWLDKQGVEAHFFLNDINKTQENNFGEADKESAGSSQGKALKEEFYRTVIKAAGKDPTWWLLPAGLSDDEYRMRIEDMLDEGYVDENNLVDLGNCGPVPLDELFGALLWQFNKAMDSPYKSVLKMALLESYLMAGERGEPLCDMLKRSIHNNPDRTGEADPYLLMVEFSRQQYTKLRRRSDFDSIEKSFFFKCFDKPVRGLQDDESFHYKERTLRACVRRWKWSVELLREMNNHPKWDLQKLNKQATALHSFMIDAYKRLTDRVAQLPDSKPLITETDLTVLGRKLFTLYSKKPGKIEYMKRIMDESKHIEAVSFAINPEKGKAPSWAVYRDNITSQVAKKQFVGDLAINSGPDPVALMLWLVQNEIYAKNTFLYFVPNKTPLSLKDFQKLMAQIFTIFSVVPLKDLNQKDLVAKVHVKKAMVVVNFFEERWKDDVETLHIIYQNSWGELYCHKLGSVDGFSKLAEVLTNTTQEFSITNTNIFGVFVPEGANYSKLTQKVTTFISQKFSPLAAPPTKAG